MSNVEFNLSMKDLASAEVYLKHLRDKTVGTIETSLETVGKMDIELDSIKQPAMMLNGKIAEFGDNFDSEVVKTLITALEDKKKEILKTEQDFSAYEEAFASAKQLAEKDLKAETKQHKKAAESVIM